MKLYSQLKQVCFLFLFGISLPLVLTAQTGGSISGKVTDAETLKPIAYATIRVLRSTDDTLVKGDVSSEAGTFSIPLPAGSYYVLVDFMGYTAHRSMIIHIYAPNLHHDAGIISLVPSVNTLEEVIIQAEKSSMELSLDKRIFNVGQDLANAGGTASDILMNIPSVSVDPEGNVRLRGSDNVRILIDGKPSGLVSFKGGSGLQQLPGSMIERVEIITNPSARYEAEGMAGIINIVLKKEKNQGFNGSFELISGYYTNIGGAANLNYRHKKINFFINYGIAYRRQPGVGSLYQEVYERDTTFITKQKNKSWITGFNNNIRGGLDFYFTETSILTASYLSRRSNVNRVTDIRYEDYLFSSSRLQSITTRRQDEEEVEPNSEYSLIYKKSFPRKGHEFIGEVKFLDNWESSDQTFTQFYFRPDATEDPSRAVLQKSLNDEYEKQWLIQLDYVQPIGKDGKFETGLRSSFRDMMNDFVVTQQNAGGVFEPLPGLDNIFLYNEKIHALYGILANKSKRFSYQGGLRAEWTDVKTTLAETQEVNPRRYANLFPSAHVTFDLSRENAIQISYSRRVRRPFYNDLSPFMTFSDSRNFFSGNPDLDPEFSHVIEGGYIRHLDNGTVTSSLYYRDTQGKIDRIRTVNDEGNAVTITENLRSEQAMGVEVTGNYTVTTWWKLDLNANFFYANIDGSNIVKSYRTTTYSWFARQTSRFSLSNHLDIQLRANYEAPQNTAQGRRRSLYYLDLAMSKDILKNNGTVTLNVLDVFNSRRMRSVTQGPNFYTEGDFQFRRRQINLTLSYRIKQSKHVKRQSVIEE